MLSEDPRTGLFSMDMPRMIGKYEISSTLGQGGMGVVYRARDPFIGRDVAIKQLSDNSEELRHRFLYEVRSGVLNHPNLVTIYDVGEQDGCPYIVMEFLAGRSLDRLLAEGSLTPAASLDVLRQVCEGLAYAHAQGVVHRDIKPGNLIVDGRGHAKILDFGIAQLGYSSSRTRTGAVIGTLDYIAPERMKGEPSDGRADVWSCGVVLYQMLTGKKPFPGDAMAAMYKAIHEDFAPVAAAMGQVIPELEHVVGRALAKSPEDRYTAAEMGAALAHLATLPEVRQLTGRPAPPATAPPVTKREPVVGPAPSFTDMLRELDGASPQGVTAAASAPAAAGPGAGARAVAEGATMLLPSVAPTAILRQDAESSARQVPVPPPPGVAAPVNTGSLTQMFSAFAGEAAPASAARPQVLLTVASSPDAMQTGKSVAVTVLPFVIGRDPGCNLSVEADPSLSKQHCRIEWRDRAYYVRDLGSRNGTWVNGRAIGSEAMLLPFGSVIRCSDRTALNFVAVDLSDLPDLTGTLVGGRYILEAPIRLSKKSALYKARHHRLPRLVAIKLLSPYLAVYPGYAEQFQFEAEIAAGLEHPNIARIIDFGSSMLSVNYSPEMELQYIATDYMEGGDLETRIAERGYLAYDETRAWLTPVADALRYAHEQEVIHGGIKTTSIVFDRKSTPYLRDFAIGTRASARKASVVFGTPDYMAPEQWDDSAAPTPMTDQYSLAVLAYYSLCGVLPFEGQADPRVRTRNFERGTTEIHLEAGRSGNETVPKNLSGVLARAFSVRPEDRFGSIAEFCRAFGGADVVVAEAARNPHAFFSYRRGGASGWATHFADKLQRDGIDVYLDVKRRDNATQFPSWMEDMIQQRDVFVCFLEKTTLDSSWVRQEVELAYRNKKPMIPIIFEDFNVSDYAAEQDAAVRRLLAYSGVTLLNDRNVYTDAAIEDLATMIKGSPRRG
jgi:serine/threonine protein kinase